jgi:hypothetical protein
VLRILLALHRNVCSVSKGGTLKDGAVDVHMRVVACCNLPSVYHTLTQIAFRLQNITHPPESHSAQDCEFNGERCLLVTADRQWKCGSVTVGYLCNG